MCLGLKGFVDVDVDVESKLHLRVLKTKKVKENRTGQLLSRSTQPLNLHTHTQKGRPFFLLKSGFNGPIT